MKKAMFFLIAIIIAGNSCVFAIICMQNNYLGVNVDDTELLSCMGTSQYYTSLPDATLTYAYGGECSIFDGYTGAILFNIDGKPFNVSFEPTVAGSIANSGAGITGTKSINNQIDLQLNYIFVNNPSTGINADTVEYEFIATNMTASTHNVSMMLMIDTMVNGNDGANISIDDALTTLSNTTIFYKSTLMPPDWWDYDVDPETGPPNLVGRGHLYNNPYGDPATEPDILVVGYWPEMDDLLYPASSSWNLVAGGDSLGDDSAVELWWTNGTGGGLNSQYSLPPGQSLTWITYYGLNQGVLLATPTISATFTVSPTISPTPSITKTYTITPTDTITPTFTQTPVPLQLTGGFPNIFHQDVNIIYWLSRNATVSLKIFTVSGEVVLNKNSIQGSKGYNKFYWDGHNDSGRPIASGIYIYEIYAITELNEHSRVISKFACVK